MDSETVEWAITEEAPVVSNGFETGIKVPSVLMRLAINIGFVVQAKPQAIPYVVILPILSLAWGAFRYILFEAPTWGPQFG